MVMDILITARSMDTIIHTIHMDGDTAIPDTGEVHTGMVITTATGTDTMMDIMAVVITQILTREGATVIIMVLVAAVPALPTVPTAPALLPAASAPAMMRIAFSHTTRQLVMAAYPALSLLQELSPQKDQR